MWTSLVPRPEEEEEKGSGFSHSCMCLIITDLSTCSSVGEYFQSHMVDCMTSLFTVSSRSIVN